MNNLGIYIHIPFCESKCAYCDFYSQAGMEKEMPEYQHALLQHIKEYSSQLDGYFTDTVYFGGGTPSYYGAGRLVSIFNALKKYANVLVDSEVTTEVNPGSVTLQDLIKLRRAGFNRLSIGVQSANDTILKNLGRKHTFAACEETVSNARIAGFTNVSVDVIYGLPSQSKEDWADTLNRVAALKPEHISCYGLKIEEGTPLYIFKDSPFLPDDDTQADMYLYAVDALSRFGYRQYEVSNFAKKGFECRHNLKYWFCEEYVGFGAAAHSYIGGTRYSHYSDTVKYCENILSGRSVIDWSEEISDFERAAEYLMLWLRTTRGITEQEYYEIYPCSMKYVDELLSGYAHNGWAVQKDGRWMFTPEGFLLSNVLIGEILEAQTRQRSELSKPWIKTEGNDRQLSFFDIIPGRVQTFN